MQTVNLMYIEHPINTLQKKILVDAENNATSYGQRAIFYFPISEPDFSVSLWKEALRIVTSEQPSLRATIHSKGDTWIQRVAETDTILFGFEDIADRAVSPEDYQGYIKSNYDKSHPIEEGLASHYLLRVAENGYLAVLGIHPALCDGPSANLFAQRLNGLYRQMKKGEAVAIKPIDPATLSGLTLLSEENLGGHGATDGQEKTQAAVEAIDLPVFRDGEQKEVAEVMLLDTGYMDRVSGYCRSLGVDEALYFKGLYALLLKRYGNVPDGFVVYQNVGFREVAEAPEGAIGCYSQNIPALISAPGSVAAFLLSLKDAGGSLNKTGLVSAPATPVEGERQRFLFDYHPYTGFIAADRADIPQDVIRLACSGRAEGLRFSLAYAAGQNFRFLERLRYLSDQVLGGQDAVGGLEVLFPEEKHQLLVEFNDTAADYPKGKTIVDLFTEQAAKTPDNIALAFEERELTYRELDNKSNQLANYLIKHYHTQPDDLVGIMLKRSEWMIVGILGILKSGAAYVPIDPAYPQNRIDFIIEDTDCKVLITDKPADNGLSIFEGTVWDESADAPQTVLKPDDLAYVIYTSGSTGKPKGVMIEHKSAVNLINWSEKMFPDFQTMLNGTSINWDLSVFEMFFTLCAGKKVRLLESGLQIPEYLRQENRALVNTVPSVVKLFDQNAVNWPAISYLNMAGEPIPRELMRFLSDKNLRVQNLYGPSEYTTYTTYYHFDGYEKVLIGAPIDNTETYLLSPGAGLVPVGVSGEICISGAGLARGYLNRPELTAEKFVPHPFKAGERLYKTGDLGRWLPDGNIEFLGRIDHQVKVRGYRIELGEIENEINKHGGIKEAVAAVNRVGGDDALVAYVVTDVDGLDETEKSKLKEEHVSNWQEAYQRLYGEEDKAEDVAFDISGWKSSYTGKDIPADEMGVWVDHTVDSILKHRPKKVLEIGCGSGLLLFKIAPRTEEYIGTDFSEKVVEQVRKGIQSMGNLPNAQVSCREASDLDGFEKGYFDTVVINSVVQYFPDRGYLLKVIQSALELLCEGGRLFIGDVRNHDLLALFHSSVQLFKANDSLPVHRLAENIRQSMLLEEELLLSPGFFYRLKEWLSEPIGVDIQLKRGAYDNELSRFRYDVTIQKNPQKPLTATWHDWEGWRLPSIERYLREEQPGILGVKNIPNGLLQWDMTALLAMDSGLGFETVKNLRDWAKGNATKGELPETFRALERTLPYKVHIAWSVEAGFMDIAFVHESKENAPVDFPGQTVIGELSNVPGKNILQQILISKLRARLEENLPKHMIPQYFVPLDGIPLTSNGKVDRKKLLSLPIDKPSSSGAYEAPASAIEKQLAVVWQEVLGIEKVGRNDNFFHLGGHSIKAIRLVNKIQGLFGGGIDQTAVFRNPVLHVLAGLIGSGTARVFAPIPRTAEADRYPISNAQRRLWVLHQFEEAKSSYNFPLAFTLKGNLDLGVFKQAIGLLLERHEILRTNFQIIEDEPFQLVREAKSLPLFINENLSFKEAARREADYSFDLENEPLFRVTLVLNGSKEHLLILNSHHIISDGWSMDILFKDLIELYDSRLENRPALLPALPIQYKDYAGWQNSLLENGTFDKHRAYWLEKLSGEIPVLDFPTDYPRPAVKTYRGNRIAFTVSKETTSKINALCKGLDVTLFNVLTAVTKVLLHRYTSQTDIAIGTASSGRIHPDLEHQIGFYVNTLVLRNEINPENSFGNLARQIKENALAAIEHESYPFDKLVEELEPARDTSRSPLFDVMIVLQNNESTGLGLSGLEINPYPLETDVSQFDLTFTFFEKDGEIQADIEYNTDLFNEGRIVRLCSHFEELTKSVLGNPADKIGELNLLPESEKHRLLVEFNDTAAIYPKDKTIVDLFTEQAFKTPDNIAVVFEDKQLTYKELDEKSNRLANYLIKHCKTQPDDLVGIMLERSEMMIVGILGILKSGAAYVPIDPAYPQNRIGFIIEDTCCKVLISDKPAENALSIFEEGIWEESTVAPETGLNPNHLAYVIYTSGSTGNPKGVMIEHRSVVNMVCSLKQIYRIDEDETVLQFSPVHFDASVEEISVALLSGAKLLLISKDRLLDLKRFTSYVTQHNVTFIGGVPSFLSNLEGINIPTLRKIIAGGEVCGASLTNIFQPGVDFYNTYGPTETTVTALTFLVDKAGGLPRIPIGKPVGNAEVYLLDPKQNIVGIGIAGEICISGAGMARGYLNRPELTEEKFVPHPFKEGGRLYKTGDLGRRLPDGNIEFLGRIDHQVKVRGFRIELGEIEYQLARFEDVRACAVLAKEAGGQNELAAYIVMKAGRDLSIQGLKDHLSQTLPEYMIPAYFVEIGSIPLTSNGKTDRKKLLGLTIDKSSLAGAYEAPATEIEKRLAEVWAVVLGVESVGRNDNFFHLGGHSIKAIQLVNKIQRLFNGNIDLTAVFRNPVLQGMAALMESLAETVFQPIPKSSESDHYPISNAQRRLWVLHQFEEAKGSYNIPEVFVLTGKVDPDVFRQAIGGLLSRHEILRTNFPIVDNEPVQVVGKVGKLPLFIKENIPFEEVARQEAKHVFDLENGPLFRVTLALNGTEEQLLILNLHHIISDGWSMDILFKDLIELYGSALENRPSALHALPIQYRDYAAWQNRLLESGELGKHRDYWHGRLSGEIPVLDFPTDHPRPQVKTYHGSCIEFTLSNEIAAKINALCKGLEVTLFNVLTALTKVLLHRYTSQTDIAIGTASSGRNHPDLGHQIGFYVNTLVLRNEVNPESSFEQFVLQVKESSLAAIEHESYPFDKLVEELKLSRDTSRSPLFDMMVVMQNNESINMNLSGVEVKPYALETSISKFDLTFSFAETGGGILLQLEYNTDLFEPGRIQRLCGHFGELAKSVAVNPADKIGSFNILSESEKQRLSIEFNDTKADYPKDKTLVDLFTEQAKKTPDNIALVFEDKELTYKELDEKSNQLANYLIKQYHTQPDDLVGIMLERSEMMIVGVLGILKSGAAYVPIDPDCPQNRIDFMLGDTACKVLVSDREYVDALSIFDEKIWEESTVLPQTDLSANDLAYVIYTSGSTGVPKGVMVEHRSIVNYITAQTGGFQFGPKETVLQFSPFYFDASVEQIFLACCNGAKLLMVRKDVLLDIRLFNATLEKHGVTHLHATPSFLLNIQRNTQLKRIVSAGDAFPIALLGITSVAVYNKYGPTETTVSSTMCLVTGKPVSIGKPLNNTEVFILNESGHLTPAGITGEICIGGAGLARGYLNRTELTAERFVPHPFKVGERMYKTGDLGRWLPDGNIEFLGRIDHQVKIRGFRIELGEIEYQLSRFEEVSGCVALAKEINGQSELAAYLVLKEGKELSVSELRSHLSQTLPEYMIPSYFVEIGAIPLTSNGKVDRKKLLGLSIDKSSSAATFEAPVTETEQQLSEIWKEVLGLEKVGRNDNFFHLGGHSIKAIRLVNKIQQQFKGNINLTAIFKTPVLQGMAALIQSGTDNAFAPIPRTAKAGYYPVSNAQRRLWVLHQFEEAKSGYNIPAAFVLTRSLDVEAFKRATRGLLSRHEILRTNFLVVGDEPFQVVREPEGLPLSIKENITFEEAARQEANHAFDLENEPLFRITLVSQKTGEQLLIFNLHHIISDGWSMGVLFKDLMELYGAESENRPSVLPALPIQYKDFAAWQNRLLESGEAGKHRDYWLKQLSGEIPVLDFPTDHPRPAVKTYRGNWLESRLSKETTLKINALCKDQNATLFSVLTALTKVLLYRYTSQTDIAIGTASSGRVHPDLGGQIGFYVNTLVLRDQIDPENSFGHFVQQVKGNALAAIEHESYPFDKLVEELKVPRDTSRSPLFDVMIVLQNNEIAELGLPGLEINTYPLETGISKYDLTFYFVESEEQIQLLIEYNTDLFKQERIERLCEHFGELTKSVVGNPAGRIGLFNILPKSEKYRLLVEFNDTKVDYPKDKTIVDLFVGQAAKKPGNIAVVFEDKKLTYKELDEISNQLANYLIKHYHTRPDDLVGILMGRSEMMIVGILGILKSGAAYVPIDPNYPQSRIDFIVEDTKCKVLITDKTTENGLSIFEESIWNESTDAPETGLKPNDLAYVIYTSGSTGNPKGVMIEHRNVVRLFKTDTPLFDFNQDDVWTVFHSFAFDFSVWEMFGALFYGGKMVVIPTEKARDPYLFWGLLRQHEVTILNQTPTAFENLMHVDAEKGGQPYALRKVIFGGEKLAPAKLAGWMGKYPSIQMINMYGITETTVHVTCKGLSLASLEGFVSNVGRPIPTTTVYVLDGYLNLCPIGVAGEMYVGGEGVCRGYLNRPELTAERFIPHPFETGALLYKTGDLARLLPGGELEYLGRIDHQVQLRGFRVELGEIEHQLSLHEKIKEALVFHQDNKEGAYLVAYYVAKEPTTTSTLRSYLSEKLPDYMVPSYFVEVETIPLTSNGKVDRKKLLSLTIDTSTLGETYEAPVTETEQRLAEIWSGVLGVEKVGVTDNFFRLGGHSIKAIQLSHLINKALGWDISVGDMFRYPSIRGLIENRLQNLPGENAEGEEWEI